MIKTKADTKCETCKGMGEYSQDAGICHGVPVVENVLCDCVFYAMSHEDFESVDNGVGFCVVTVSGEFFVDGLK